MLVCSLRKVFLELNGEVKQHTINDYHYILDCTNGFTHYELEAWGGGGVGLLSPNCQVLGTPDLN
jgi:hypothetical protein